jgi:hypothetical protein
MWERNVQSIPGVLDRARRTLAAREPALVAAVQRPEVVDRSGLTARILASKYRLAAVVDGVPVYEPRRAS